MVRHRSHLSALRRAGLQYFLPLSGRWLNQEDSFSSSTHGSQEDANSGRPENIHLGPPHSRWRRDALQPPEVLWDHLAKDTCVHIPAGGLRRFSHNAPGNRSTFTSHDWPRITTSFVFKKHMGRMNSYKLFRYYSLNSGTGGSAIFVQKNLLPDGAVVHHTTTCQGRDHTVWCGDRQRPF